MRQDLDSLIKTAAQAATTWRRTLHEYPELSFCEVETTRFIESRLMEFGGFQILKPAPTGLMAVLQGKQPGKTITFRADIDALPMQEDSRNSPCSKTPGVMHACGHDGHAAALLGAASVLRHIREDMRGELRFIFQHAEEQQPGGAQDFIGAGLLAGTDLIYGMHFQSQEDVGTFWLKKGPMMAATYTFDIVLNGCGTHAAFPHLGVDSILAASQLIIALNHITSRTIDPTCRALLSVSSIHGGNSYNSLPEQVVLQGTLRILDRRCEEALLARMRQVTADIGRLYSAACQCTIHEGYGALENDPVAVDKAAAILAAHFGKHTLHEPDAVMGGEDFSAYLTQAPGCYYRIGARKRKPDGRYYPSHQSRHEINDEALYYAIAATVYLALES